MFDYIKGSVADINPAEIIVETGSIGYRILISFQSYEKLRDAKQVKLYLYHLLREDEESLYGFFDKEERRIFTLLISVTGIGPNTARMMLSSLSTDEITRAITEGDVNKIKSVKGIGLKTAQRAIIELKDKISKGGSDIDLSSSYSSNPNKKEASSALILLGFNKTTVDKALDTILSKEPSCSLEDIIKKALKLL